MALQLLCSSVLAGMQAGLEKEHAATGSLQPFPQLFCLNLLMWEVERQVLAKGTSMGHGPCYSSRACAESKGQEENGDKEN